MGSYIPCCTKLGKSGGFFLVQLKSSSKLTRNTEYVVSIRTRTDPHIRSLPSIYTTISNSCIKSPSGAMTRSTASSAATVKASIIDLIIRKTPEQNIISHKRIDNLTAPVLPASARGHAHKVSQSPPRASKGVGVGDGAA